MNNSSTNQPQDLSMTSSLFSIFKLSGERMKEITNEVTSLANASPSAEKFLKEITEKFKTPLLSNDYYKIAELLFEVGILSNESIMELNLYITSLKRNTSYNIEKWRIEARLMDLNEEDYIKYKTEEEELRKEFDKSNSDILENGEVEIIDEVEDVLPKITAKKSRTAVS